jgi:nucleotide-binding universal stress UspA family protein
MGAVVLGYVPTPEGLVALEAAIHEATLRQASIIVVNVAVRENFTGVTFADEKELDPVGARISKAGLKHETRQILDASNVATEILAVAEKEHAELIVVGLRRTSPLGMALLGSNAQRIILSAPCPVLSVRPS